MRTNVNIIYIYRERKQQYPLTKRQQNNTDFSSLPYQVMTLQPLSCHNQYEHKIPILTTQCKRTALARHLIEQQSHTCRISRQYHEYQDHMLCSNFPVPTLTQSTYIFLIIFPLQLHHLFMLFLRIFHTKTQQHHEGL